MDNKGAPRRRLFWVTSNKQALQITDLGREVTSVSLSAMSPQSVGLQHIRQMDYLCIKCDFVCVCMCI